MRTAGDGEDFEQHRQGSLDVCGDRRYLASTPLRLEKALANLESGNGRTSVAQTADLTGQENDSPDVSRVAKSVKL